MHVSVVLRTYSSDPYEEFMAALAPDVGDEERDFLLRHLMEFLPEWLKRRVSRPWIVALEQLVVLVVLIGTVGPGYLYGMTKW